MTEYRNAMLYATVSALVGGGVWLGITYAMNDEPNWLFGAFFMLAFGVVVAYGQLKSQE